MNGSRCLLNAGPHAGAIDDLLPSLPDPYDDDGSAALHVHTTVRADGAGAVCSSLLLDDDAEDANDANDADADADDENNSMSQDLSRALEMSSLCSSPPARERHRSSVSTISSILLRPGRADPDETARSLSVPAPAEHERPGFFAKASSIFFRRNSTPRDQHTQAVPGTVSRQRPQPALPAAKSAAADSLRHQQQLEDGLYARVIANFRAIGWCSSREIESVEYKRSLINAQWDEKISLLSHAQCYK
ncbi:uncharacterized protein DI49_2796 [Saccharomyces eubayanus]|uniref:uncharacterized protein n=1 Tax=Saccharomyces eubayanus TaxID=1080349 RepID=UPI0006C01BFE|nr:hypothetical protein DI49_2796 [Saccharomyces eubayanus]KOG98904.1 hypothetical protein DI49_2796 [Saccharomyces eubayanus]